MSHTGVADAVAVAVAGVGAVFGDVVVVVVAGVAGVAVDAPHFASSPLSLLSFPLL